MKKICNFVKNLIIFVYILLIIFVTICLLSYNDYRIAELGNISLIPIIDENLKPDYTKGDLLLVEKRKLSEIKKGDVVFFYRTFAGETTINYAKVTRIEIVSNTQCSFVVEGLTEGEYKFSSDYYIGNSESTTIVPKVGTYLHILQSKWGFLFLGVFPSLIAFLYTLYSVIAEVRGYNDEDEEEEIKPKKKKKTSTSSEKNSKTSKSKKENGENKTQTKSNKNKSDDIKKDENKKIENKQEKDEKEKIESKTEKKEEDSKKEKQKEEKSKEIKQEEKEKSKEEVKTDKKEEPKQEAKVEKKEEIKPNNVDKKPMTEEQKKALVEAKLKNMTEEQKKALLEAKLKNMTEEQKKALIEAKKKKMEEQKNK